MLDRYLLTGLCALLVIGSMEPAAAQARYDDHELRNRFVIKLGGYSPRDTSSKLRFDSKNIGLGTIVDLEDGLNVEDSARVGRLDGYFRFNRAHRIEWAYYALDREGTTAIEDEIQIGDIIFPIGIRVDSEWKVKVAKVSYAWSFINTDTYEFYIGAGLNIRDLEMSFRGERAELEGDRVFDESGSLPLPTLTAGMRYNVLDKLAVLFRMEAFAIQSGDQGGRIQDAYLLLEYDVTKNFGIGGGLNSYTLDLEFDVNDDFFGEIETSYWGLLLYLSASF